MTNQYPAICEELRPEIERVRNHLRRGGRPSEVATALHTQGLGSIRLLLVFREATGASLADLKSFGEWWGEHGVTDADAFDAWAREAFGPPPPSDDRGTP